MIVCGTRDNSPCESLLQECGIAISKAISPGHATKETCKHAREILRSQSTCCQYWKGF